MAFNVNDIVKKINGNQKYKVKDVLENSKYKCEFYPNISPSVSFVFKEQDLELA